METDRPDHRPSDETVPVGPFPFLPPHGTGEEPFEAPTNEQDVGVEQETAPDASGSTVPPRTWPRRMLVGGVAVALMVGSGSTGAVLADHFGDHGSSVVQVRSSGVNAVSTAASAPTQQLAKVAEAVQPSVVSIVVTTATGGDEGSGVVLRSDGTILTNNHVVVAAANSGSISVHFADGRTADAAIIGRDPSSDLAVIKANGVSDLTPATIGASSALHVGDTVLAIGSPLGLDGSVTSGIVSALHRTVDLGASEEPQQSPGNLFDQRQQQQLQQQQTTSAVADAIQTDAAINPGNSGGALVDANGAVVGINTAIASLGSTSQSGNIGVGFAIPIEEATSVATQLINGETPKHALLGVQIDDDRNGALVAQLTDGGAAASAGLQVGDVITKVDANTISDGTDLSAVIRSHQPGDKVTIAYSRNGERRTTTATLGSAG